MHTTVTGVMNIDSHTARESECERRGRGENELFNGAMNVYFDFIGIISTRSTTVGSVVCNTPLLLVLLTDRNQLFRRELSIHGNTMATHMKFDNRTIAAYYDFGEF